MYTFLFWLVRILGTLLITVTLLPLIPTGFWFVRGWDFPRFHISLLLLPLLVAVPIAAWRTGHHVEGIFWLIALVITFGWQASHVMHFSPIWPKEVPTASDDIALTKMMIVNLKYENDKYDAVAEAISSEQADLLLLIEPNDQWHEKLSQVRDQYTYHHEEIADDGLGLALWSNLELISVKTEHVVSERRPSIWAKLRLVDGREVNFVGVHPTPPGLKDDTGNDRRDSRVRDAELLLIAKSIANHEESRADWVVAGDFNDVAWSHTTRLFKRTSGMKDPRVGRSFMGTFHSQYPPFRFPIDHVFFSDGFAVGTLQRKLIPGSDHFAVITTMALVNPAEGVDPEPEGNDPKDADEIIDEGKEDAQERGVAD